MKAKRRTTVEYRDRATNSFVRQYRPESVVYQHVDPLSYVVLTRLSVGKTPQLPSNAGVSTLHFTGGGLGGGLPLSAARKVSVSLFLENRGDIDVRVVASLFGVTR